MGMTATGTQPASQPGTTDPDAKGKSSLDSSAGRQVAVGSAGGEGAEEATSSGAEATKCPTLKLSSPS